MWGTENVVAVLGIDDLAFFFIFLLLLGNCVYSYIKKPSRMPDFVDGGRPFVFFMDIPDIGRVRMRIQLIDVDWNMMEKWNRGETVEINRVQFEHEYPKETIQELCSAKRDSLILVPGQVEAPTSSIKVF